MKTLRYLFFLFIALVVVYLPYIVGGGAVDFRQWPLEIRYCYLGTVLVAWVLVSVKQENGTK